MKELNPVMIKLGSISFSCFLVILVSSFAPAQQVIDPHFNTTVASPAYSKNYPRVLFDEAHNNSQTAAGPYKPFADLMFSDGYQLIVNRKPFAKTSLDSAKILVIANALGAEDVDDEGAERPAFTDEEADLVRDWVRGGGALLLIADDPPFSSAAETLAKRLDIDMGKGTTIDQANSEKVAKNSGFILYSRENQLLIDHAITRGRNDSERISRVMTFVGQSLKGPEGTEVFLKLAEAATDRPPGETPKDTPAAGRAQAMAFKFGKGRVVVLGDAAMLSAQLTGHDNQPFGMNTPDVDNKQLALNIMHWLSGLLK
ncbi:MAG TPA: DUF4350 domain-containing protein [Pyrinomonadaceae bacterium]|nr:DUF4350 domain-containing protein [Pyrinomonadaceae bacterium]